MELQPDNKAAEAVIDYACVQNVTSLHPHLETIFRLALSAGYRRDSYPWRDSGVSNFDFLASLVGGNDAVAARRARCCLLETRHPVALDFAIRNVGVG